MIKFSDIQDAFLFVSSAGYGIRTAILCKDTGQMLYRSDMDDLDEIDDDDLDWDMCIEIPHKNDLDVSQSFIFEFVEMQLPDDYRHVKQIFRKRGAYRRFKDFLETKGLLEMWYDFESKREEQALRRRCLENEIELSD
jgi:hypothetical protein